MSDPYKTYALKDVSRHPDNKNWLERWRIVGQYGTPIVSDYNMPKVAKGKTDRADKKDAILQELMRKFYK